MRSAEEHPGAPLPLLATAFATKQLQEQAARASRAGAAADATAEAAEGYEDVMRAALVQLQRTGELAAAEGRRLEKKGRKGGSRAMERLRAATNATYRLLQVGRGRGGGGPVGVG